MRRSRRERKERTSRPSQSGNIDGLHSRCEAVDAVQVVDLMNSRILASHKSPVPANAGAMPSDNFFRADENERLFPRGPKATGEEPEDSINCCKSRPWIVSLQHSQLLPQYQILDEKVLAGTKGAH
jgi:hypothetical protein